MTVDIFTIPFVGRVDFGDVGGPLTVIGLLAIMNAVNFTDGMDGLASGVCAISAATFAIISFSLEPRRRRRAGPDHLRRGARLPGPQLPPPARIFMGDCGSNLLGLLLGATIVEGSLKTQAVVALIVPLVVLAVPFLDTTFVVLKRLKYHRPVYSADANHFHHRFARIGFSQRKHRALPLRLGHDDGGRRDRDALRALLRRPRQLPRRLDGADGAGS